MARPEVVSAEYENIVRLSWMYPGDSMPTVEELIVSDRKTDAVVEGLKADATLGYLLRNLVWLDFVQQPVITIRHPEGSEQTDSNRRQKAPYEETIVWQRCNVGESQLVTAQSGEGVPSFTPVTAVVASGELTEFNAEWFGRIVKAQTYRPVFYDALLPLLKQN